MTAPAASQPPRSVAVFCGSNFGSAPAYAAAAAAFGTLLAQRGTTLVYGGTHKGLMGVVADAALAAGGTVVGVINQRLFDRGHLHPGLSRHEVAPDMRARKARMAALADAFVALPGGLGTLEELLEAATLTQLGDHTKPCAALDVLGFYAPLRALLATATAEGFMKPEHRDMLVIEPDPARMLDALATWQPPTVTKWIGQPGS
jgi:uncharacterized protein (TIGR00730 family)